MKTGIIAAQDGKTIDELPLAYSTEHSHLKVDSRPEMNRLKIYDDKCGTQVLSVIATTFGTAVTVEEVFYKLPHNLKYIPRVTAYMLIRDAPPALASLIGWFAGGYIEMPGAPASESVFFRVDETHISFVHTASTFALTTYNSILQNMIIRAKIIINSNEAADEPYDSKVFI